MNPLYDLYRMPRNIDMDYYKKNYRGEGTWTSNIYGYYNDQKQWVPDGTIELSGPMQQWAYFSPGNNNPYWITNANKGQTEEERAYGYITASYEIIPGLKIQGRLNMDRAKYKGFTKRMGHYAKRSRYRGLWYVWTGSHLEQRCLCRCHVELQQGNQRFLCIGIGRLGGTHR